jgi:signal transduction histidine kinase/DNA-binding response OmpR family regulator
MKKVLLFLLLFPVVSIAQIEKQIDSLKKAAATEKNPELKSNAISELALIYLDSDPQKTQPLLDQLKAIGIKNKNPKDVAFAYLYEGHLNSRLGKTQQAVQSYTKSSEYAQKLKDPYVYLKAESSLAQLYLATGKDALAEKNLLAIEAKYKNAPKTSGLEDTYFLLGTISHDKNYLNTALRYFLKTDAMINEKDLDGVYYRIGICIEIASIYKDLKNKTKALEAINKAMELQQKTSQIAPLMETMITKAEILLAFDEANAALPYLEKALGYAQTNQQQQMINSASVALGEVWQRKGDYNKSIVYLETAKAISKKNNNTGLLIQIYNLFARNYIRTNNFKRYEDYLHVSEDLLKSNHESLAYLELIRTKIEFAKANKRFDEALALTQMRDKLQQEIDQKTEEDSFEDFETKYQSEKKAQQIKLLSVQKQLAEKQKNIRLFVFSAVLLLLIAIGFIIYYLYKNKIRTAEKLREINELKSKFFANISHEFRMPLTLIKSPLQTLQNSKTDANQKNQLALIDKNASRMLELVNQLLELSKIDSGHFKLILKQGALDDFLHSITEPFVFQANENGIPFISNIEKTGNQYFDKDVIEKIVTNLLSDALKYTAQRQPVYFSGTIEKQQLHLRISNSGTDLHKEDLPGLFERFYQKNENQNSSGIGLALVKELVEMYNGTIEAALDGQTLRFLVKLPLDKTNKNAVAVPENVGVEVTSESKPINIELPILLIVDDNAEIRNVISGIFSSAYKIFEAPDGEKALKIARKEIPDCIISDLMMPKMHGLAFTNAIRNDELTSFVPLILLTAKTSEETHIEALKSTADAFLTKPFNHEILKATVAQLIAERRKLQERYSRELVLRPMDIVINPVDEKFIDRLQLVLEKELSNPGFTTDDFAGELGMSRMQLHRKLKTLIGVSATEFLRNERLKAAAGLLRHKNANASEIAYSVGFNDVSYFSKCFRERYQMTPTEYAEKP